MNSTSFDSSALTLRNRWLVVDDESALSELIADVLETLDLASVENFTAPTEALNAFSTRAGGFDLVVTDRDMPGINGLELSRQVHTQSPDVKVILVSANTDDLTPEVLCSAGISAVVTKPFNLARLMAAVQSVVNSPKPTSPSPAALHLSQAA